MSINFKREPYQVLFFCFKFEQILAVLKTLITILLFFFYTLTSYAQFSLQKDSVLHLIEKSKNKDLEIDERFTYAFRATTIAKRLQEDSLMLISGRNLALIYGRQQNFELYRKTNQINLKLAKKLTDTLSLAFINNNLGWYYYDVAINNDSAYYYYSRALKYFKSPKRRIVKVGILLNMADILETEKDYISAEETAINGIKLLEQLPADDYYYDLMWSFHNLIGLASMELDLHDKALEYHDKALAFSSKMQDNDLNRLLSINNKALVYKQQKTYDKAIALYQDVLDNDPAIKEYPETHVLFLDNLGHTKFLAGKRGQGILNIYETAYQQSDSIQDDIRKLYTSMHLGEYYNAVNKNDEAVKYAKEAYNLALRSGDNDAVLETLLLKSGIETGDEAKASFNAYVKLSDSLQKRERLARNKFALIKFENARIKAENEQISKERYLFLLLSMGLLITLFLVYIIINQRSKNNELLFAQQQQQANEEIYNLMIQQHNKVEEARAAEKRKISEELHDGVLSRLFGTRLSLDSINMNTSSEAIETRSSYIDELKSIEQDIRKVSHELNVDFVSGSNFLEIVESLVDNKVQTYDLSYTLKGDDNIDWSSVSNKTKIHFYRIIQESIQNIHKHANAKTIKISFKRKNNVICLTIKDDGKGFDTAKIRHGIGLKNINSRVSTLEGALNIKSTKNLGTSVLVEVPI